ncbi:MAG: FixH family protein [Planctomycetota bacterium]
MKKGWQWPIAIGAFLSLTAIADITTLYVASTHPTLAAEPDYYAKALRWDQEQRQRQDGARLGWQFDVIEFGRNPGGFTEVGLKVADATGSAIHEANISLEAFHVTRPKLVSKVELTEAAPGFYVGRVLSGRRAGPWKLNFRCERGEDLTFHEETQILKVD